MVDVIIPTIPGREESLARLIDSLELTADELNIYTVRDSVTCGAGWREGIEATGHEYVLLACDDQEFVAEGWADVCIETVERGVIPCPRVWLPDGSIESQGGDMAATAHVISKHQKDQTRVDYTTIPFCSREMIEQIGMLDVHYASDVWVSYRGRQLGYPTWLRHGFDVCHYQEEVGRGAGMSQVDRDQMDCATVLERIEELAEAA